MKKDYSEFQFDDYDHYRAIRENTRDLRLDYFNNTVFFDEEKRILVIHVDPSNEYETMRGYIDQFEREDASRRGIHEDDPEELEDNRRFNKEQRENNIALMNEFHDRYQGKLSFKFEEDNSPDSEKEPLINVLSGARIRLAYGEGILDFLYADIDTHLTERAAFYQSFLKMLRYGNGKSGVQPEERTEKVYSHAQEIAQEFFYYQETFSSVQDAAYRSLYTAMCPPVFSGGGAEAAQFLRYRDYLIALQEEYKAILEFCYDETFYPEVLGKLMPHERYTIYLAIHHLPSLAERTERVQFSHHFMGDKIEMPYGMEKDEIIKRLTSAGTEPSEAEKEFAERFGMTPEEVHGHVGMPAFIRVNYSFHTVEQILNLEFTKMLEQNVRFRKCKRCGKYFIMKGNYDTNYCDRIAEGETRSCQQIAAQENYKARNADNKALPIYSKYYKRYAARVKVNQIKEKDFNAWRYQAILKRDECADGKITPEELTEWMESCFPNRKPRKSRTEKSE